MHRSALLLLLSLLLLQQCVEPKAGDLVCHFCNPNMREVLVKKRQHAHNCLATSLSVPGDEARGARQSMLM